MKGAHLNPGRQHSFLLLNFLQKKEAIHENRLYDLSDYPAIFLYLQSQRRVLPKILF